VKVYMSILNNGKCSSFKIMEIHNFYDAKRTPLI
jgi:hypothetical protein